MGVSLPGVLHRPFVKMRCCCAQSAFSFATLLPFPAAVSLVTPSASVHIVFARALVAEVKLPGDFMSVVMLLRRTLPKAPSISFVCEA